MHFIINVFDWWKEPDTATIIFYIAIMCTRYYAKFIKIVIMFVFDAKYFQNRLQWCIISYYNFFIKMDRIASSDD